MSATDGTTVKVQRPAAPPRGWSRERILGWVLVCLWILLGAGLVTYLFSAWNPELFAKYAPSYLSGLYVTLTLVAISIVLGAILSVPICYARMSKNRVLNAISYAYVYFFRGTPLLAQTFLIYYGFGSFRPQLEAIGLWGFFREAWYCAVFAFALNTAAYQAEIMRGAIESVGKGQWEAASALGLSKLQTLYKIILPQALIVALRPYGNEIILMIKGSAIVAIITVYDLMGETRRAFSRTFDFQTYLWAALLYLSLVEILRHLVDWIERRITRHLHR
ncbi:amino acid ABC transporter membrane protein 2 (PAAT family) [Aminobacter aminovorans]|jgi:polar amino acid transport system permease protein|uniref:Arginine ABC transporter permease protein ArtM n=1 Tax=Aminobacter aminovorans TaxID=83263 RepID=A0A380WLM9_AMIAI|nr:ABC transporter permease [Aminobacter aminovorans]TCS27953.1 amino acid ABC transporter membrane protein 2 (PAAT family) [Aminobacter aminovorans]SUU89635.1 Arginine ABC transporter permease protein ArtM [Aminobacter aminovorans]